MSLVFLVFSINMYVVLELIIDSKIFCRYDKYRLFLYIKEFGCAEFVDKKYVPHVISYDEKADSVYLQLGIDA